MFSVRAKGSRCAAIACLFSVTLTACERKNEKAAESPAPSVSSPANASAKVSPKPASNAELAWSAAEAIAGRDPAPLPEGTSLWDPQLEGQDATQARLSHPYIAAARRDGVVYIADKDGHAIRSVDLEGNIHTVAGTGIVGDGNDALQPGIQCALAFPNGLWVHPQGRVYILDRDNSKIRRLNLDGNIETIVHVEPKIETGRGLWVSSDESTIWIASKDRLVRWTKQDGVNVAADGFVSLANLTQDAEGRLFVADRGANLVYEIKEQGQKIPIAGSGDSAESPTPGPARKHGLNGPRALVALSDGRLLIGTQSGRRIWQLRADGSLHPFLDGQNPETTPGQVLQIEEKLEALRGLSLAPDGALLLTHGDAGEVLRFAASKP